MRLPIVRHWKSIQCLASRTMLLSTAVNFRMQVVSATLFVFTRCDYVRVGDTEFGVALDGRNHGHDQNRSHARAGSLRRRDPNRLLSPSNIPIRDLPEGRQRLETRRENMVHESRCHRLPSWSLCGFVFAHSRFRGRVRAPAKTNKTTCCKRTNFASGS